MLFFFIFFDFFFQAKSLNAVSACKMQNFAMGPKNSKSLNILKHFWYHGHFCSSKTKKIRGGTGGTRLVQNSRIYSCLLLRTVVLFLIFWEEYFVKSGRVIFNPDDLISEYENKLNKGVTAQYSSKKLTTSLTAENEEEKVPFETQFLNSCLLVNEENIFEENEDNILEENEEVVVEENKKELTNTGNCHPQHIILMQEKFIK